MRVNYAEARAKEDMEKKSREMNKDPITPIQGDQSWASVAKYGAGKVRLRFFLPLIPADKLTAFQDPLASVATFAEPASVVPLKKAEAEKTHDAVVTRAVKKKKY